MTEQTTLTFATLEAQTAERNRQRQEEQERREREQERADEESRQRVHALVVDFLADRGIDPEDAARALRITTTEPADRWGWIRGQLEIPEHVPIEIELYAEWLPDPDVEGEEKVLALGVSRSGNVWRVRGSDYQADALGRALLSARLCWEDEEKRRRQEEAWENGRAEKQAAREARQAEADETRRQWLESVFQRHPIMVPLMQTFHYYLSRVETMEADLEAAGEAYLREGERQAAALARKDEQLGELDRQVQSMRYDMTDKDGRIDDLYGQIRGLERRMDQPGRGW
jgi:hypothetical protein